MTRTIRVIKVGGRPQLDAALPATLAAAHRRAPGSLVVVHGGGDEVSVLQSLYGVVAQFSGGRRVTSALDLDIVRMALSGSANKRLVSALNDALVSALGVSGEDAHDRRWHNQGKDEQGAHDREAGLIDDQEHEAEVQRVVRGRREEAAIRKHAEGPALEQPKLVGGANRLLYRHGALPGFQIGGGRPSRGGRR